MTDEHERLVRVGAVVAVALGVLAWLVLEVSSGDGLFSDRAVYRVTLSSTRGLSEGAEVRYEGVTVGSVRSIEFDEDPSVDTIEVAIQVRDSLRPRMDESVHAELRSNGPLGDRLIELRRGPGPIGEPLPEGSLIPADEPLDLAPIMEEGVDLFGEIRSISESLNVITARLVAGDGVFGRLLKDKEFGDRTLTDLEVSIRSIRDMVEEAGEGKNLLGALVGDEELAAEVSTSLRASARNLQSITTRLEAGEGLLGQAMRADSDLSRAASDFRVAAANMRAFSDRLESADGLAWKLLFDPEYGSELSSDLGGAVRRLDEILDRVERGEGTLGLLVNDDELHDNVNRLLLGLERTWLVRYVVRRTSKKGLRQRVDRILKESDDPDTELLELLREVLEEEAASEGPEDVSGATP